MSGFWCPMPGAWCTVVPERLPPSPSVNAGPTAPDPRETITGRSLGLVWFGLVGFSFNASPGPRKGPKLGAQSWAERGAALRKPLLLTTLFWTRGPAKQAVEDYCSRYPQPSSSLVCPCRRRHAVATCCYNGSSQELRRLTPPNLC
jgi:hypothetical protein